MVVAIVASADVRRVASMSATIFEPGEALARSLLDGAEPVDPATREAIDDALRGGSTDSVVHAAALWLAFDAGADLRLSRSHARSWLPGLQELIHSGHLDAAAYALPRLEAALPQTRYLENMAFVFRHLPPAVRTGRSPFVDDRSSDVQIVVTPGATTVIIAFCGGTHQFGMPINLLDRWFAQLGSHVIYLRDRQKIGYTGGVAALGRDVETTAASLTRLVSDLGARRVVCIGHSVGATGALRYASAVGAERVLALSPITGGPQYAKKVAPHLQPGVVKWWGDLVPLYRDGTGVRVHILYGEKHAGDRQQSVRMAVLPGVTVEALSGWESHHIMGELLRTGRLEQVLGWLVSDEDVVDLDRPQAWTGNS